MASITASIIPFYSCILTKLAYEMEAFLVIYLGQYTLLPFSMVSQRKKNTILYGYRIYRTHARWLSPALVHENRKSGTRENTQKSARDER